ncbi:MAG: septum formation initiator family protein [Spirochaetales bacterium]|nr:septum formation initiator family protein [Spirochaetales bacterium]
MIRNRLLVSAYVGVMVYLVTVFFFGSTGIFAYRQLLFFQKELKENITAIDEQGKIFQQRVASLQSDPEQIRIEARTYHLVRSSEGFVRIRGRNVYPESISPGRIVRIPEKNPYSLEPFLRAFSLCISLSIFLITGFRNQRGRK